MPGQPGLGGRVRDLRRQHAMSQRLLAGTEISVSYVSLVESGRREPTERVLALLAKRLGTTVDYLAAGQAAKDDRELQVEVRFAELALANGAVEEARARLDALAAVGTDDADFRWRILRGQAMAAEAAGDLEDALRRLEQLRELAARSPQQLPWLQIVVDMSRCYREAGDLHRAVDIAEQALARINESQLGPLAHRAQLTATLAAAYRERGDLVRAEQLLDRVISESAELGSRRDKGAALWNASILATERGRLGDAIALADRALALFAEDDDERNLSRLKVLKAWVLLSQNPPRAVEAQHILLDVLPVLNQVGSTIDVAYAETELARASLLCGDAASAIRRAQDALRRLGDAPRLEAARARVILSRAFTANGETSAADLEIRQAVAALEQASADRQAAGVWREIAELEISAGRPQDAARCYSRALDAVGIGAVETACATQPRSAHEPVGPAGESTGTAARDLSFGEPLDNGGRAGPSR